MGTWIPAQLRDLGGALTASKIPTKLLNMFLLAWSVHRISAGVLAAELLKGMKTDLDGNSPPRSSFFDPGGKGVPSKDPSYEPSSLETSPTHSLLAICCQDTPSESV